MPQAVAAWVASAWSGATIGGFAGTVAAGTVTAVSVGIGTAVVYAAAYIGATVAIGFGLSAAARAFGLGAKAGSASLSAASPLSMTRDPKPSRRVIYGKTRVSGPMLYSQVTGSKNEYLHFLVAFASHPCAAIETIWFNDVVVPLSGNTPTGTYAGVARINKHLGAIDQMADADLVSESGGKWTDAHRLRGVAYAAVRLTYDQDKYPTGLVSVSAFVSGKIVRDPRDDTDKWSDNPALCIRDYLVDKAIGFGADAATEIDEASFIAAANACDESVDLAGGGSEKRYTLNGCFDLSAEPATVLENMCSAMAGFVIYVGGRWVCQAGVYPVPTVTLTEKDFRGPISVQTRLSARDTCNRVKGTFVSPAAKFQPTDFTPIVNAMYLADDGGLEIWRDIELPFTTSHSMAQRLAKIELERTRQEITVSAPCKLTAYRVQAGGTVRLNNSRMGWVAKPFLVTGLKFSPYTVDGTLALGVDLTLREIAPEIFDWASGEETTLDPAPNTNLPNPFGVGTPTNVVLANIGIVQSDGTVVPRLRVSWDAPNDQHVLSGGKVRIQSKKHSATSWSAALVIDGAETSEVLQRVESGVAYDVRVQFQNNLGVKGGWATVDNVSVATDTTIPAAPTGLLAWPAAASVLLTWANNAESDRAGYKVYRRLASEANDIAGATVVWSGAATSWSDFQATPDTAYRYWVTCYDRSGNESAPATPVTGTPANISGLIALLTNEAHTVPADASGTVTSFDGAFTDIAIYKGSVDDSANWTITKVDTACTSALSGTGSRRCTVSALSADVGYVDITAVRSGYPSLTKRFVVSKSKAGSAGANAKIVRLTADAQIFRTSKLGVTSPSSITLTAAGQNLSGSPTFSIVSGTATLTGIGTTRALAFSGMSTDAVTVKVDWDGVADYLSIAKLAEGTDGAAGSNGTRTGILDMYQWAASAPTSFPTGTSTYTWATGQFTAPGTLNGWSLVPGAPVAGQKLWIIRQIYTDSASSTTSAVTWSATSPFATSAAGSNGSVGANGQRVGFLEVYQWAATAPALPTGTSTYTWATGQFTAPSTPNGWSLVPGAPVAGQTLWATSETVSNNNVTATDTVTWTGGTVYAVGKAGTDGSSGADGLTAKSVYIASLTQPSTPTGNTPAGWSSSVPAAAGAPVWTSSGMLTSAGVLSGVWSTPQRISGSMTFSSSTNPATTAAVRAGDVWFDTTDTANIRIKLRNAANTGWDDNTIDSLNVSKLRGGDISGQNFNIVGGGRFLFNNGSVWLVQGTGFGSSNQFVMWFGPAQATIAGCTEANAIFYLKTNGAGYFGGALNAGTLTASIQSADQSSTAQVTLGPFGTNGNNKLVTLSYSWDSYGQTTADNSGSASATVQLYRKIGTGAEALVATLNATGSTWANYEAESVPHWLWQCNIGGSLTYTDNNSSTADRTYRAVITSRSGAVLGGTSTRQIISITSAEEQP